MNKEEILNFLKQYPVAIIRVAQGRNTTLSHLYIDGLFCCYLLEDSIRQEKIRGNTCIPEGNYELSLNPVAGMNSRYGARYPSVHRGMVEIIGIPDFSLVFIHIGNYHTETMGCPLTGAYWQFLDDDYRVLHSAAAYSQVYKQLVAMIDRGEQALIVRNMLHLKSRREVQ